MTRDDHARVPRASFGFRAVSDTMERLTRLLRWRWDIRGLEHVPAVGGAVVTWNHHSHLDFLAAACDIYLELDRPARMLAHADLFDKPVVGHALRLVGAVPVSTRSAMGRGHAFEQAVRALHDGHLVLVAPEGHISPTRELLAFRSGAARMAQLAGVPLIPSVGWGTHRVLTVGRFRPLQAWRLDVAVQYGPGQLVEPDAAVDDVTAQLRAQTQALLDEVRGRYPAVRR